MRLKNPDILKGIAVILMIQVHIMELFASTQLSGSLTGKISLFLGGIPAAPVFMIVMGYLMAMNKKTINKNLIRGFKLILLGFLLNMSLNMNLFIHYYPFSENGFPYDYLFGVDIFFLAGLSIIICSLIEKLFKSQYYLYFLLALGIGILTPYIPNISSNMAFVKYIQAYFWGYYHWSYFPVFPWLAYPLLGYAFLYFEKKWHKLINITSILIMSGLSLIIVLYSFNYGFVNSYVLQAYYHHNIWFILWAIAFLIPYTGILYFIIRSFGSTPVIKYLIWLGKHVTSVYVIQWLIIGNIATSIYKTQNWWQSLLWFAAIIVITSLLVHTREYYLKTKKRGVL